MFAALKQGYERMQAGWTDSYWTGYTDDPSIPSAKLLGNKRTTTISPKDEAAELSVSPTTYQGGHVDTTPPYNRIPTCEEINAHFIRVSDFDLPDTPTRSNKNFRILTNVTACKQYKPGTVFFAKEAKTNALFRAQIDFHAQQHHPKILRPVCTAFGNTIISPYLHGTNDLITHVATKITYDLPGEKKLIALIGNVLSIFLHIHSNQFIVGGIDPTNFIVTRAGTMRFVGTSKARKVNSVPSPNRVLNRYSAPEEFGMLAGPLTTATDIWGLGCLFAEMLGTYFSQEAVLKKQWKRARSMRALHYSR